MKWTVFAALLTLGLAGPANAAHFEFNGDWGHGSFDINIGHGGLFRGGILGGGFLDGGFLGGGLLGGGLLGGFADEFRQGLFEDRFEDLQADYDDGLANITDFYSSDEYTDIVDHTDRLVDRYGSFVTGVDRSIDRLGDAIDFANDRVTSLDELLAKYQERDLSEERLARIERLINGAQDLLEVKIDLLTDRQTTRQENLVGNQEFQPTLTSYRDEFVAAGGSGSDAAALASLVASTSTLKAMSSSETAVQCDAATGGDVPAAPVPEPAAAVLALMAALGLAHRSRAMGAHR